MYSQFNRLNSLVLGDIQYNGLSVSPHWFHAVDNRRPYKRRPHSHTGYELHMMMKGCIRLIFSDSDIVLQPNQGVIIPPGTKHGLMNHGGNEFFKFTICFEFEQLDVSELPNLFARAYGAQKVVTFDVDEAQRSLLYASLNEATRREPGFVSLIQLNLLNYLTTVARVLTPAAEMKYPVQMRKGINDERFLVIEEFIRSNLKRITVQEIASYVNLSEKQVSRIICASTNYKNTSDMIAHVRVEYAKKLLANPQLRSRDIAEMLGFSNEYYFNRFFKKMEGLPPGRYRETLRAR